VVKHCEGVNELSGFIKRREFVDCLVSYLCSVPHIELRVR
jgi:hypothetical protein